MITFNTHPYIISFISDHEFQAHENHNEWHEVKGKRGVYGAAYFIYDSCQLDADGSIL